MPDGIDNINSTSTIANTSDYQNINFDFEKLYRRCLSEYKKEALIWDTIQSVSEVRTRPFNPEAHDTSFEEDRPKRTWLMNNLGSQATREEAMGSFCNFVESTIQIVASGILSYVVPLPEYSIQYEFIGNTPSVEQIEDPIKKAMTDLGKKVCQLFLDNRSGVHIQLLSAIKDLLRYGHCVIYDRFVNNRYIMQSMDLRDFIFDADPFTNEIYIIIRPRVHARSKHYDVWLERKPWLFPPQTQEDTAPYLRLRLDKNFKVTLAEPINYMPIRICKLFNIPGYKFGYGYGQSIINESRSIQKYYDIRGVAAMRSLKPPIEVFGANFKDVVDPDTGMTILDAIEQCQAINRNPGVPIGTPMIAPIITQDPNAAMAADQFMALIQSRIEQTLLVAEYRLPQQPNMSAREVSIRAEQKLQLLTPIMSAVMDQCVEPSITNITTQQFATGDINAQALQMYRFNLMAQTGGMIDIQMKHRTKFDKLRGLAEYSAGEDALIALQQGASLDPSTLIIADIHKLTRDRVNNTGVNKEVLLSQAEITRIMEEQKEAAEQQQMAQTAANILQAETKNPSGK